MEGKKSFTAYCDWIETFEELNDEEAGKLIKHLFRYVNDQNPEPPDRITKLLFSPIKATLKRDLKKWEYKREQNKANAKKRWNKNDATECDRINRDANNAVSVSVSDSDSDSDKEKEVNIPELKDFINYAIKNKPKANKEQIRLKYKAWKENNWKDGNGKKIKNWKSKLLNTLRYIDEEKQQKQHKFL